MNINVKNDLQKFPVFCYAVDFLSKNDLFIPSNLNDLDLDVKVKVLEHLQDRKNIVNELKRVYKK